MAGMAHGESRNLDAAQALRAVPAMSGNIRARSRAERELRSYAKGGGRAPI